MSTIHRSLLIARSQMAQRGASPVFIFQRLYIQFTRVQTHVPKDAMHTQYALPTGWYAKCHVISTYMLCFLITSLMLVMTLSPVVSGVEVWNATRRRPC
jgi:hypothetical protein